MKVKRGVTLIVTVLVVSLASACSSSSNPSIDFSDWNDDQLYAFLHEVKDHLNDLPVETDSIEEIVKKYSIYFSEELSENIVRSLYIQDGDQWKIPDGDGGYIFIVPGAATNSGEVTIEYGEDDITIRESYEEGMYKMIEYKIEYDERPIITEWIQNYD